MGSTDFETEKARFKEYYAANSSVLRDASDSLRTLLSLLLTDNDDFETPLVTSRVKDRDECIAKFSLKYQSRCEEAGEPYEIRDHITDLIGLRVTCLYESDVPLIRSVLAAGFEVLDETDKTRALETQEGVFGYKGVHLDLRLLSNRRDLPEYRRFRDLKFEVQIRTEVQNAWSVLDHKIKYKKNIPHALKRRINRLAALFELADQEFLHIRDETRQLEEKATLPQTKGAPATKASAPPAPLDTFAFLGMAVSRFPTYTFFDNKADGFVAELLRLDPDLTADAIELVLTKRDEQLHRYRAYQYERFRNRLNPYTTIRHALYAENPEKFSQLLFDLQRATFDRWLAEHNA